MPPQDSLLQPALWSCTSSLSFVYQEYSYKWFRYRRQKRTAAPFSTDICPPGQMGLQVQNLLVSQKLPLSSSTLAYLEAKRVLNLYKGGWEWKENPFLCCYDLVSLVSSHMSNNLAFVYLNLVRPKVFFLLGPVGCRGGLSQCQEQEIRQVEYKWGGGNRWCHHIYLKRRKKYYPLKCVWGGGWQGVTQAVIN